MQSPTENLYLLCPVTDVTRVGRLTPRQRDVLVLLCEGMSNRSIGKRLNIAVGTVKVHIAYILRTLRVTRRTQAVLVARSLGFPSKMGVTESDVQDALTRRPARGAVYPLPYAADTALLSLGVE